MIANSNTDELDAIRILNGSGDLGIDGQIRPFIGQYVQFQKVCKSGLHQIRTETGELFSVPKRNLDPVNALDLIAIIRSNEVPS